MTTLTGTGRLVRLILRRDRLRLLVWTAAIAGTVYAQAEGIRGLYEPEELVRAARLVEGNAAFIAMAGPPLALETIGGRTTFEISGFAIVMAALMQIFLVTRHVRGDEESGRAELLRSTVVGRHAAITATMLVAAGSALVLGGATFAGLVAVDLGAAGSAALAVGIAGTGLVFGSLAAVTSQVTVTTRIASGLAGAVLAAAYLLRGIGDVGSGTLSWLSPVGWGQALRPFASERWWVLAVLVAAVVVATTGAYLLASHRDVGGGLLHPRPGPPRAPAALLRPAGLALRQHRAATLWWALSMFLGGVAYGSIGGDVEDFVGDNEVIADILAQEGGDLVESFLGTTSLALAVIAAGFTVQLALRPRSEEESGRVESLGATALSLRRWMLGHLAVLLAGTVGVLVAAGFGTGITFAVVAGDGADVPRMIGATLAYLPALLVLAGVGVLLHGVAPSLAPMTWAVLGACFVIDFFGAALSLPGWVLDLSPFHHVPRLPAAELEVLPLAVLSVVAAALTVVGVWRFERRDLRLS